MIHACFHGRRLILQKKNSFQSGLMSEASRCLALSEAGAKKKLKTAKGSALEWEILHADAVVLLGLTNALR